MANLRTIRQRIRSVQNTQKITQAMQMVAGAKLHRSQEELFRLRPYADRLAAMTKRFLEANPGLTHPLLGKSVPGTDIAAVGLVVIASDTGLCGTYNERVRGLVEPFLAEYPSAVTVAVGKKAHRLLTRLGAQPRRWLLGWGGRFDRAQVEPLAQWLQQLYLEGAVSSWWVVYTRFISALSFKPTVELLLPLERGGNSEAGRAALPERILCEPDVQAVAEGLLERFARTRFAQILLEAFTSEHSARMVAMRNATDNASEMIQTLTRVRNKVRQAAITTELIEVVSGANALQ